MRLLLWLAIGLAVLALTADGARKKTKGGRDRDTPASRQQGEEEETATDKKEDVVKKAKPDDRRQKEKKEEKPLKKAEDESSSEEDEDKKKKEEEDAKADNMTVIIPYNSPSRRSRSALPEKSWNTELNDGVQLPLNEQQRSQQHGRQTRHIQKLEESSKIKDTAPWQQAHIRRRRDPVSQSEEDVLPRAREMNDGDRKDLDATPSSVKSTIKTPTGRSRRDTEQTIHKAEELNSIVQTPIEKKPSQETMPGRSRRDTETTLQKAGELNSGQQTPLDQQPSQPSTGRSRRDTEQTLQKAGELNSGVQTPIEKKPSQETMSGRFRRDTEQTLVKAGELNSGVQTPVENKPAQETMPKMRRSTVRGYPLPEDDSE